MNNMQTNMTPAAWAALSPCDRLAHVDWLLMQLASGQSVKVVRHNNNWVEYLPGAVTELRRLKNELAAQCASATGKGRSGITIGRTQTCGGSTPWRY